MQMAEMAISDVAHSKANIVTISYIQEVVSKYFNIKSSDLISQKRSNDVAFPRQIAMFLCRDLIGTSLPKIGEEFGGRDHTTVMFACKKIQKEIEKNSETKLIVENVKKLITNN